MSTPSTWSRRGVGRAVLIGCLALAVGAGLGDLVSRAPAPPPARPAHSAASHQKARDRAAEPPPKPGPIPAADAVRALVAPLQVGSDLAGWQVRQIWMLRNGLLPVELERGQETLTLVVARQAPGSPAPVAHANDLAVYVFGHVAAGTDAQPAAQALAQVLQQNRARPRPDELGPFRPESGAGQDPLQAATDRRAPRGGR